MASLLPNRLKELRKEQNMTQEQLAKKINKTRSTVAGYETERKEPDYGTLITLASIFNVTTDYLLGVSDYTPVSETVLVPVVSETTYHQDILVKENICGYSALLSNETEEGKCFYYKVNDDSMINSRIMSGDLVLIKFQELIENGKIFLVSLDNNEVVLRKVYVKENTYIFQPDNPGYHPYILNSTNELNERVKIIGKALHAKFNI